MGCENTRPDESSDTPEGGIVIRQVQYAWLWSSMPLLLILAALLYLGILADPFMPAVLCIIILVPKYVMWRRTAYTLTEDLLIYQRGSITSSRKYQIPISRIKAVRAKFGIFGRALGYQYIDLTLDNDARATLAFVPIEAAVAEYLQELIDACEPEPQDAQDSDEPRPYDPDVSRYDPDDPSEDGPPDK